MPEELKFCESCITPEIIREIISDESPDDNLFSEDIDFSEPKIIMAMRLTVSDYHGITPRNVAKISLCRMPFEKFLIDGIIANLYDNVVDNLARNTIHVEGGQISVKPNHDRMQGMAASAQKRRESFETRAKEYKLSRNLKGTWAISF